MKYPNAYSGVKKIFASEILSVICTVMLIVSAILGLVTAALKFASDSTDIAADLGNVILGFGIPTLLLGIGGAVLALIAFILQIVGVSKARKDEPMFKRALIFILLGIISTAVCSIIGNFSDFAASVWGDLINVFFSNLSKIATILVTYFIIVGIISLAEQIGNESVAKKGKAVINLIMTILVLSLLATITASVFPQSGTNTIIAAVLTLAAAVIEFIALIIYLLFLGKAKKMLKETV